MKYLGEILMDSKIPKRIKNAINEAKKRIKQLYKDNLDNIILYGSYARGDYSEYSDIDLLITLKEMASISDERKKYINDISEISLKYDTVVSILPVNVEQYEINEKPIFVNIHKEGVLL